MSENIENIPASELKGAYKRYGTVREVDDAYEDGFNSGFDQAYDALEDKYSTGKYLGFIIGTLCGVIFTTLAFWSF